MRWLFGFYAWEAGLRPDSGGFRKLWELARALQTLGHAVHLCYPRLPGFGPLTPVGASAYPVVRGPGLRPLTAALGLARALLDTGRRLGAEVLYVRSHLNPLLPAVSRRLGARLVVEVNADTVAFQRAEGVPAWKTALVRWTERRLVRRAHRVVALTPGLRRMVVERYGVAPERVVVIPSGTDPEHFRPLPAPRCRAAIGLEPGRPVVGFVGLFYRHQGVGTLLRALGRLAPRPQGLLVGDGVMRAAWQALARELGLGAAVRFTGQVPYAAVPPFLGAMDVLAAPFTADRGETSPFKILDALAAARPVVASDLPAVRALAEASQAVVLVPPEDPAALAAALAALLASPARREALGRRGRQYVAAHHAWPVLAARVAETVGAGAPRTGRSRRA
jgi:glycosyltransferase involved in cell wall biosynthesis